MEADPTRRLGQDADGKLVVGAVRISTNEVETYECRRSNASGHEMKRQLRSRGREGTGHLHDVETMNGKDSGKRGD